MADNALKPSRSQGQSTQNNNDASASSSDPTDPAYWTGNPGYAGKWRESHMTADFGFSREQIKLISKDLKDLVKQQEPRKPNEMSKGDWKGIIEEESAGIRLKWLKECNKEGFVDSKRAIFHFWQCYLRARYEVDKQDKKKRAKDRLISSFVKSEVDNGHRFKRERSNHSGSDGETVKPSIESPIFRLSVPIRTSQSPAAANMPPSGSLQSLYQCIYIGKQDEYATGLIHLQDVCDGNPVSIFHIQETKFMERLAVYTNKQTLCFKDVELRVISSKSSSPVLDGDETEKLVNRWDKQLQVHTFQTMQSFMLQVQQSNQYVVIMFKCSDAPCKRKAASHPASETMSPPKNPKLDQEGTKSQHQVIESSQYHGTDNNRTSSEHSSNDGTVLTQGTAETAAVQTVESNTDQSNISAANLVRSEQATSTAQEVSHPQVPGEPASKPAMDTTDKIVANPPAVVAESNPPEPARGFQAINKATEDSNQPDHTATTATGTTETSGSFEHTAQQTGSPIEETDQSLQDAMSKPPDGIATGEAQPQEASPEEDNTAAHANYRATNANGEENVLAADPMEGLLENTSTITAEQDQHPNTGQKGLPVVDLTGEVDENAEQDAADMDSDSDYIPGNENHEEEEEQEQESVCDLDEYLQDDEDDDGIGRGQKLVTVIDSEFRFEYLSKSTWNNTCELFLRSDTTDLSGFEFDPFTFKIMAYQAVGCYELIRKYFAYDGGFLGDEVGLGKTITAYVVMTFLYHFSLIWKDYEKNPDAHTGTDDCPRAKAHKIWFACPCKTERPELYQPFFKRLRHNPSDRSTPFNGPSIVIVPAGLIDDWVKKFQEMFKLKLGRKKSPKLVVAHSTSGGDFKITPEELEGHYNQGSLTSKFFIITSSGSIGTRLLKPLIGKETISGNLTCNLTFGSVWMDECHSYRSSNGQFITGMTYEHRCNPFLTGGLFPMSGTLWEKGPGDLVIYANWFIAKWRKDMKLVEVELTPSEKAAAKKSGKPMEKKYEWNYKDWLRGDMEDVRLGLEPSELTTLQRGLDKWHRDQKKDEKPDKETFERLVKKIVDRLTPLTLRRKTDTKFLDGKTPIVDLPPQTKEIIELEPSTEILEQLYMVREKHLVDVSKKLVERMQDPEKVKQSDSQVKWTANRYAAKSVSVYRPLASFPNLQILLDKKELENLTMGELVKRGIISDVEKSVLWNHLPLLEKDSPRYEHLWKLIETAFSTPETLGNGTNRVQHIVVFSSLPFVAGVVYALLKRDIRRNNLKTFNGHNVKLGFIHGKVRQKDRTELISRFQGEHGGHTSADEHLHILVTTTGLSSLGIDMYRATLVLLMESLTSHASTKQALGRVRRIGQVLPQRAIILTSKNIPFEAEAFQNMNLRQFVDEAITMANKEVKGDEKLPEKSDRGQDLSESDEEQDLSESD